VGVACVACVGWLLLGCVGGVVVVLLLLLLVAGSLSLSGAAAD
jgi:hypothetical protein